MNGSPEYLALLDQFEVPHRYFDDKEQAWAYLDWSWDWFEQAQNDTTIDRLADTALTLLEYEYGDKTRHDILVEARSLHARKNKGYAGNSKDRWANFRLANKFRSTAVDGVYIRLSDKYSRLKSLRSDPDNDQVDEPITETLRDFFAYLLIAQCLRMEGQDYV